MMITSQEDVTAAVLQAMQQTPNARLRDIMASFVRHIHGFAREMRLTEDEFETGIALLNRLGSIESGERLRTLAEGFASGALRPFPIAPRAIYHLERAIDAYRAVSGGTRDRGLLKQTQN